MEALESRLNRICRTRCASPSTLSGVLSISIPQVWCFPVRRLAVSATAWVIAGALAGVAVLFMATQDFSGAGLGRGTHAIALIAFPAAILGGMDSTVGAVVGGIIVGLTEALSAQYISFDFSKSAVFLVMLAVLVLRPSGLFGTKEFTRV